MSKSVGMASNNRRKVKVSIGDASVQQVVLENQMAAAVNGPAGAGPFGAAFT
ncbi:hypothetical protein [Hoeflea olei]|uniref:hypothetical protein n=1 Tax=Hoeflea olei TaxID=1480615 RepID=UPI001495BF5F|nr:hypothetical protein [Hoeflea olei]